MPYDGALPQSPLIDVSGTLYGTTDRGGAHGCTTFGGCGTVFSITATGEEQVLYSFAGTPDGMFPSGLIKVGRTLYGTTGEGGVKNQGTVFTLKP